MNRARQARVLAVGLLLAAACMPARYRETPPPEREPAGQGASGAGAATGGAAAATVVGHVTPDGTLTADTLARSLPDTARVERETVVTGEIRPAADDPDGALAPGWRIQAFASRSEAESSAAAARIRDALDDPTPVYLERDDPWFKVQVGDLRDRAAAERLKERLAGLGWPDAWAVRMQVRTVP